MSPNRSRRGPLRYRGEQAQATEFTYPWLGPPACLLGLLGLGFSLWGSWVEGVPLGWPMNLLLLGWVLFFGWFSTWRDGLVIDRSQGFLRRFSYLPWRGGREQHDWELSLFSRVVLSSYWMRLGDRSADSEVFLVSLEGQEIRLPLVDFVCRKQALREMTALASFLSLPYREGFAKGP